MIQTNEEIESSFKERYERRVREPAQHLLYRVMFGAVFWLAAGWTGMFVFMTLIYGAAGVEKFVIWYAVRKLQARRDELVADRNKVEVW